MGSNWTPYPRKRRFRVGALLDGSAFIVVFGVNLWHVSRSPIDPPQDGGLGYEQTFWRWEVPRGRLRRYALGILGLPLFLPFCWLAR